MYMVSHNGYKNLGFGKSSTKKACDENCLYKEMMWHYMAIKYLSFGLHVTLNRRVSFKI